MRTFLELYIDEVETYQPEKDMLRRLLFEGGNAKIIRDWVKKNVPSGFGTAFREHYINAECAPCEDWESALISLASSLASSSYQMTEWEKADSKERKKHADDVAKYARKLADVLEEKVRPNYPSALKFFDTDVLEDIFSRFSDEKKERSYFGAKIKFPK